jgi:LysM repeat protein
MKMPNLIPRRFRKRPAPPRRPVQTTLKATAAARRGEGLDDYDTPEPTTSLSTAFIIVLLLHVVAVVGIYIFNHIKATRPPAATIAASATTKNSKPAKAAPVVAKTAPAEKLVAPEKLTPIPHVEKPAPAPTAKTLPSGVRVHRVQANENLTKIATMYSVTVADLEEANGLNSKSVLKVDQLVNIPGQKGVTRQPAMVTTKLDAAAPKASAPAVKPVALAPKPVAKPAAATRTYVVDKGDTVTYIAKRFDVSTADLLKLNGITDPKKLQPGKTLKVPAKTN